MHDPLTVAFEIRRPWPRTDSTGLTPHVRVEEGRWEIGRSPFWIVAGKRIYWPCMVTVWHRDPSGYDTTTCPYGGHWRLHVHHWRLQIHPFQQLRRRLLTRCEVCGGRSVKDHPVNVGTQWDGPRGHWWQGEPGLTHSDCYRSRPVRQTVTAIPDFDIEVD